MRTSTPTSPAIARIPWMRALWCAAFLGTLPLAATRAQTRTATVHVHVTVMDFAVSDVIGVHGMSSSASTLRTQTAGVSRDGDAWRITTGGSSVVGVRLEMVGAVATDGPAPAVELCEVAAHVTACRRRRLPANRVSDGASSPELLLRLGRADPAADAGSDQPVRLTIAYIGM